MLIPTCIIKFLELVLTIACLTLHNYSYDLTDLSTLMLCSGTYIGYVVVLSGEIVGEMLFAPLDLVQDVYFSVLGMTLFAICGGRTLNSRLKGSQHIVRTGDNNTAILGGSIAVAVAAIMLFDLGLAYMDSDDSDEYDPSEAVSAAADAYVDAWFSASGGTLFGACGGLTLNQWKTVPNCERKTIAQAAAVCALANASLLAIDALLAIFSANKNEESDVKGR